MAYTQVSSLDVVQAAYEQLAYFALRSQLLFDQAADVMPTNQSMPGSSVIFTKFADLSAATSALNEIVDVTPVAMSDSQVTVTLAEYGNAVNTTAKLRGTSFLDVDAAAANIIGYNAGDSIDQIVRDVLAAGTENIFYGSGGASLPTSRATVGSDDILTANDVRKMTASLRKKNVAPRDGGFYVGYIHPDVSYDLRRETGNAAWNAPHINVDTANIYTGEIGTFESIRFIETPRAKVFENASNGSGSSTGSTATVDVYCTHILGQQALAKAYSTTDGNGPFPRIIEGPVVDALRRFNPTGWYWLGGYGRFREEALGRIESSSSIGANT
jgi:N4-gp56 family major capsid protein